MPGQQRLYYYESIQCVLYFIVELISQTPCVCPGYSATYDCIIDGSGATVWQGSAVLHQCQAQNNGLLLRHSEFNTSRGITESCGGIVARSIGKINNTYFSQLTVIVSQELNGTEVECAHDNGASINRIGSKIVTLTTGNIAITLEIV
jgi:hypothetical protein